MSALSDPVAELAPAQRVLVVEDEEALRFTLQHNLRNEGYEVLTASRGDDALALARQHQPDLILLDLMLPGVDGMQVCRLLRRDTAVPIIMLTALGGESDRVAGLDLGADDYIAKPFGLRELLARIRALLRRSAPALSAGGADILTSGDLVLDLNRRELRRNERLLHLKPRAFDLLSFLVQHPRRVFTRAQLLEEVWGPEFEGGARTVDVHVRWLRQAIEDDPGHPRRILTLRGSGYLFDGS